MEHAAVFRARQFSGRNGQAFRSTTGTPFFKRSRRRDPIRTLYNPADFDFQLRPGSAAVDAGIRLPGINDDFTGRAPDLGAYEAGRPMPHYGPRE